MKQIDFSGGLTLAVDRIEIADGLGTDEGRYVPEFTNDEGRYAVCVWGHCDPKHSYKTVYSAAAASKRYHPDVPVYRNGRLYMK